MSFQCVFWSLHLHISCSQAYLTLKSMFFVLESPGGGLGGFYIKWRIYLQHAMFSASFPEIFWFFFFDGGIGNRFRCCFLARGCILMFPFENYRASAPRLLSDTSKTVDPGLQPRGVSKIHTVKINLRALHPSAGLTLTL